MKKITLNFIGLGYNEHNQANVKIYDKDNLIVNRKTYNNKLNVCFKTNKVYKLIAKSCRGIIYACFYVNESNNCYTFTFCNCSTNRPRIITFLLTDSNYRNLPIEKGEITFG